MAAAQETLEEWLRREPFTLAMSSSFFGFFAHAGALRALCEAGLHPARVCGSSSGSIIASLYCGGLDPSTTLPELLAALKTTDILTPFWRAPLSLRPGFFRINEAFLLSKTPLSRLEAGRVPISVSTYDLFARRVVTHSEGDVHTVVAASCAIPGIMSAVQLNGRTHVDGGVGDLLGLASCTSDERVLSVDLLTQGLMTMRSWHVKVLGARPRSAEAKLVGCTRLQLRGLPFVGPATMSARAVEAMEAGAAAMRAALKSRGEWGGERVHVADVPERGTAVEEAVPVSASVAA